MNKIKQMVQVMHKRIKGKLAVGHVFKFRSGDAYRVLDSGAVHRVNPKPYRGKAGRKQYLRERRAERALA